MPCFHPIHGFIAVDPYSGRRRFSMVETRGARSQSVPCGRCVGCRLERSRQWAARCQLEASLYDENSYITLTYSDVYLPSNGSLVKKDFQLFMKRLRKTISSAVNARVRFFACGEYGEESLRPHYHACLFGFDFPDKRKFKLNHRGEVLYRSEILDKIWGLGHCSLGALTFDSAAYVARYVMKKVNGDAAELHYRHVDDDGVVSQRQKEFVLMSRRPGIGRAWFDKYKDVLIRDDFIVVNGVKCKPPRYFDKCLALVAQADFEILSDARVSRALEKADDNTPERLAVREACLNGRVKHLKREL